jgi:hypothetical protein
MENGKDWTPTTLSVGVSEMARIQIWNLSNREAALFTMALPIILDSIGVSSKETWSVAFDESEEGVK